MPNVLIEMYTLQSCVMLNHEYSEYRSRVTVTSKSKQVWDSTPYFSLANKLRPLQQSSAHLPIDEPLYPNISSFVVSGVPLLKLCSFAQIKLPWFRHPFANAAIYLRNPRTSRLRLFGEHYANACGDLRPHVGTSVYIQVMGTGQRFCSSAASYNLHSGPEQHPITYISLLGEIGRLECRGRLVPHAVSDLTLGIWSHVRLKRSKESQLRRGSKRNNYIAI
ncbi:hypothetical protein J6590_057112 [Homalodisca vitripennis]|nr:hypothetical protein J6590_057112 [Homalodisca vitripennis]